MIYNQMVDIWLPVVLIVTLDEDSSDWSLFPVQKINNVDDYFKL